jgi:6-phosphofructokinase 1
MNAAIRSVLRAAFDRGAEVYGIRQGYKGLLEDEIFRMKPSMAGGIIHHGGTILRTARCPAFKDVENQKKAVANLRKHDIEGLIVIGGDGSLKGAEALYRCGMPVITMPGTIDNDMPGTDETIGFDTAVNTVRESVSRIRDTAASHERAALVEVMGRHAGHIALAAGLACGAEYILVPEVPFSREKLARSLVRQMKAGRTNSIIICAEGADDARALGDWLKERTSIDICTTILGYIQRGGAPSARDAMLASVLGFAAVDALLGQGLTHHVAGVHQSQIVLVPYEEAEGWRRQFSMRMYQLAAVLGAAQKDSTIDEDL